MLQVERTQFIHSFAPFVDYLPDSDSRRWAQLTYLLSRDQCSISIDADSHKYQPARKRERFMPPGGPSKTLFFYQLISRSDYCEDTLSNQRSTIKHPQLHLKAKFRRTEALTSQCTRQHQYPLTNINHSTVANSPASRQAQKQMGRSPCCEREHTNKGAWTREEDKRLVAYIQAHGEGCWRSLPKSAGLLRCGKSCRLRWINYLRPDLKRGNFTEEEDELIIKLHSLLGNR